MKSPFNKIKIKNEIFIYWENAFPNMVNIKTYLEVYMKDFKVPTFNIALYTQKLDKNGMSIGL